MQSGQLTIDHPQELVTTVTNTVEADAPVRLSDVIAAVISEHCNNWSLKQCFKIIDSSPIVDVAEIGHGDTPKLTDGETEIERQVRYWAAVATVEDVLELEYDDVVAEHNLAIL